MIHSTTVLEIIMEFDEKSIKKRNFPYLDQSKKGCSLPLKSKSKENWSIAWQRFS